MPAKEEFEEWWLSPDADMYADKFDSRKGFEAGYARGLAAQHVAEAAPDESPVVAERVHPIVKLSLAAMGWTKEEVAILRQLLAAGAA